MKKIFTLLAVVAATAFGAYAQKTCNLGIRVSVTGSPVAYGDTARISVTIKNNGPQNIAVTDTMFFGLTGATQVFRLSPTQAINNGDSFTFVNHLYLRHDTLITQDLTQDFCFTLYNQSQITVGGVPFGPITYNDPDESNNSSCASITRKKSTSGISNTNNRITTLNTYPNPANNTVNFEVATVQGNAVITVKDITGRTVMTQDFGVQNANNNKTFTFDVANLTNGMYFIQFDNGTNTAVSKLTVAH